MKVLPISLAILLAFSPMYLFADSYDGPYCYEDPVTSSGGDDPSGIRGTCKFIPYAMHIRLDDSVQQDYFLAKHDLVATACSRDCDYVSTFSEILEATTTSELVLIDHDTPDGNQDLALVDKPFLSNFVSSYAHISTATTIPAVVAMKRDEMKAAGIAEARFGDDPTWYGDFLALFPDSRQTVFASFSLTGIPKALYTFDYLNVGAHIHGINPAGAKPRIIENDYVKIDESVTPPRLGNIALGYRPMWVKYTVPITSPVKDIQDYWTVIKKDGKPLIQWDRSTYLLDDGTTRTLTRNDKVDLPSLFSKNSVTPQEATTSVQVVSGKGFFARMVELILSWFR
jgi:hypothetical protein